VEVQPGDTVHFDDRTCLINADGACSAPRDGLTVYAPAPQSVPVAGWPERQEWPEIPHLPHEERVLRITVDSSASGVYTNSSGRSMHTNSSAHLAWLRNELGDKLTMIPTENLFDQSFFVERPPNAKLNVRPCPSFSPPCQRD
jgi:hypothetical protein